MFSKILAFFYVLALSSVFVSATASCTTTTVTAAPTATSVSQCNTSGAGPAQCCVLTETASTYGTTLLGLLGITVLNPSTILVGLGCTPILATSPICLTQKACCTDNDFTGIVNVGCNNLAL